MSSTSEGNVSHDVAHLTNALAPGMHSTTIDGLAQQYHVAGQGPVCIAHSGGPGISWNYLRMPEVEQYLTMVYLEPIGTGASGRLPDPRDYNLDRYASQLDGLISQLGLERPLLLGHSYGGFVALRYQVDHPGRLSGLILYDTSPVTTDEFWGSMQGELERAAGRHAGEPWVADTMAAWLEMFSFAPDNHSSEQDLSRILRRMMPIYFSNYVGMKETLDAMFAAMTLFEGANHGVELRPFDVRPHLGSITIPLLVIAGQADPVCAVRWSRELHDGTPGSTLTVFEQSGHFAHIEEPAAFARAIAEWLAASRFEAA